MKAAKKIHTTNYIDTFIEIAEDSPRNQAEVPPLKGEKLSIANMQYEMLRDHPYEFSSDDVIFRIFAIRNEIPSSDWEEARSEFFSKGQACFRCSPLTKQYGWGIHSNSEGKIAMVAAGTEEYENFQTDPKLEKTKAMRSKRA